VLVWVVFGVGLAGWAVGGLQFCYVVPRLLLRFCRFGVMRVGGPTWFRLCRVVILFWEVVWVGFWV